MLSIDARGAAHSALGCALRCEKIAHPLGEQRADACCEPAHQGTFSRSHAIRPCEGEQDLPHLVAFLLERRALLRLLPLQAGQVLLRRAGAAGVVVIGLRRTDTAASQQWDAHAWLLGARGALTGGPAASGFTATTVYEVPDGRRAAEVVLDG